MRLILILLALFLIFHGSYGCHCKTFSKFDDFRNSDLVFLGQVIESAEDEYFIAVLEVFKGNLINNDTVIRGKIELCTVAPKKGEIWLIYSYFEADAIYASSCGYSRSFRNPTVVNLGGNIPPPPINVPLTQVEIEILKEIDHIRSLNELSNDIISLRQLKILNRLDSLSITEPSSVSYDKDNTRSLDLTQLLLVIIVLLNVILLVKVFKKK